MRKILEDLDAKLAAEKQQSELHDDSNELDEDGMPMWVHQQAKRPRLEEDEEIPDEIAEFILEMEARRQSSADADREEEIYAGIRELPDNVEELLMDWIQLRQEVAPHTSSTEVATYPESIFAIKHCWGG